MNDNKMASDLQAPLYHNSSFNFDAFHKYIKSSTLFITYKELIFRTKCKKKQDDSLTWSLIFNVQENFAACCAS